jgi:putative colanic acid biosynthesis acetyltransferase WcaF
MSSTTHTTRDELAQHPDSTSGAPIGFPVGWEKVRSHLGAAFFNMFVTYLPSHFVRQSYLRALGMKIGRKVALMRGAKVIRPERISIGNNCIIGFDCFFGGEAGIQIGNNVNIASYGVLLGGHHDIDSPGFDSILIPIVIEDHCWLATRVTVTGGLRIHRGAVCAAGAVITKDVPAFQVVGGVPAKRIRDRNPEACTYVLDYQPWFF